MMMMVMMMTMHCDALPPPSLPSFTHSPTHTTAIGAPLRLAFHLDFVFAKRFRSLSLFSPFFFISIVRYTLIEVSLAPSFASLWSLPKGYLLHGVFFFVNIFFIWFDTRGFLRSYRLQLLPLLIF